jgi:hypothetical protein
MMPDHIIRMMSDLYFQMFWLRFFWTLFTFASYVCYCYCYYCYELMLFFFKAYLYSALSAFRPRDLID